MMRRDKEATKDHDKMTEHESFVSFTMEFRCNLSCSYCMIEGLMERLVPEDLQRFEELLDHNRKTKAWQGLILTGAEITLRPDLPELARKAKSAGFEHVRIQTHGMRLAQETYCQRLVEAGVDQFFVSVPGADALMHDAITGVPGSYAKTMRGLANLERHEHVSIITNTVITSRNFRTLPDIVESLSHLQHLSRMEFWNYWPMRETDSKNLVARHTEVLPFLRAAIECAYRYRRGVEVKNFPQCMLGEYAPLLVNDQPQLFIDPAFWSEFERNGFYQCAYREQCASGQCLGLNEAYIAKFGCEEEVLSPLEAL